MSAGPTLSDRLMYVIARAHAQRTFNKVLAATRQATSVQRAGLLAKIRRNAESDFGRKFHFDRIRSVADFRRHLPILKYEDHHPFIERVKAGEISAMFGGRQQVRMFALTSGSTDQPKYIPVTDHFLNEYRAGWNAFGIKALLDHPQAFLRRIAQISSRMDETHTSAGIACGAITGLMAATQKRLVRKYYVTPGGIAEIDDPAAKYYTIMRLAIPSDVAFMITASPSSQLKLARTGVEHAESIIRDVHDGGLRADMAVPKAVRDQLGPRMQPAPAEAKRLDRLLREHGRLLPRHYWNLAFLANWTGGTMGLYLSQFPEYFGDVPVRDVGLMASEGRMSIPVEDGTPAGILDVTSHFYEFLPTDQREEISPDTLLSHEVEVGREYYILLTTSAGLYRYDIGDVVRVVGFAGEAPIIEFLNKGSNICSLSGEKVTEHQIILAMERASRELNLHVPNFVLSPQWEQPPFYVLHVEQPADGRNPEFSKLAGVVERELCEMNIEYASRRHTQRLAALRASILPAGTLDELDRRLGGRHRRSNEQYKHRYLYCKPGDDAELLDLAAQRQAAPSLRLAHSLDQVG